MSKAIPENLIVGRIPQEDEPDTCLIGARGIFFARVVGNPLVDAEQVARLFAAAPELLLACEAMLSSPTYGDTPSPAAVEMCRAAIAKAKGTP